MPILSPNSEELIIGTETSRIKIKSLKRDGNFNIEIGGGGSTSYDIGANEVKEFNLMKNGASIINAGKSDLDITLIPAPQPVY